MIRVNRYLFELGEDPASLSSEAEKLRRLSDEVSELSKRLAKQLSTQIPLTAAAQRPLDPEFLKAFIKARRMRDRFFPTSLFSDPAWDMLLDMMLAELRQVRITVSALSTCADVPQTTGLRWISALVENGLLIRKPDAMDRRRVFLELTSDASLALRSYFASIADFGTGQTV